MAARLHEDHAAVIEHVVAALETEIGTVRKVVRLVSEVSEALHETGGAIARMDEVELLLGHPDRHVPHVVNTAHVVPVGMRRHDCRELARVDPGGLQLVRDGRFFRVLRKLPDQKGRFPHVLIDVAAEAGVEEQAPARMLHQDAAHAEDTLVAEGAAPISERAPRDHGARMDRHEFHAARAAGDGFGHLGGERDERQRRRQESGRERRDAGEEEDAEGPKPRAHHGALLADASAPGPLRASPRGGAARGAREQPADA